MDAWQLLPIIGLGVLVLAVVLAAFAWERLRSAQILEKWAEANGYTILSSEYRSFLTGPFWWNTSKGQTVYRVTILDSSGQTRTGWVKCGSFWFGLVTDDVRVVWD